MASNVPDQIKKMEEVLLCAICLDVYEKPKTLQCMHTFCEECINTQIEIVNENDAVGIRCPKCRAFSNKGVYINLYIVDEFVDVYKMSTAQEKFCEFCDGEVRAEFRCIDCKMYICLGCQKRHNKTPSCRGHKYTSCDDDSAFLVDHHVFCEEHNDQTVDLYCIKCEKSICLRCKLTSHDKHDTETIDTALKQLIPQFKEEIRNIEEAREELKQANVFQESNIQKFTNMYDNIVEKYDKSLEDLIAKARSEHQKAVKGIKQQKDKDIENMTTAIESNKEEMKSRHETVALAKTSLQNVKGSSLMRALKSGLMDKVAKEAAKPLKHQVVKVKNVVYEGTKAGENLLGSTRYTDETLLYQCPLKIRHVPYKFDDFIGKCANKQDIAKYNNHANSIGLVDQTIWIPQNDDNTNVIDVYRLDGERIKTITHKTLKRPCAVQQVNQYELLAACENGLHVLDMEGTVKYTVMEGIFTSISLHGNKAAALERKKRQVLILTQLDDKWQVQQQFTLKHPDGNLKTLHLVGDIVYVCFYWQHRVHKYSTHGELLAEYGTGTKSTELGQFHGPFVNGSDRDGSLIVCDAVNNRFQLLTIGGMWKELTLDGVERPIDVLIVGNSLFVLWGGNSRVLSKFTTNISLIDL